MDMNELAKEVCLMEGGAQSLTIAQVKEVLKCVAIIMVSRPEVIASLINNGEKHKVV